MKSMLKLLVVSVAVALTGCGPEGMDENLSGENSTAQGPAADEGAQLAQVEQSLCSPAGARAWANVSFYSQVSYALNVYWVNEYCQEVYMGQMAGYGSIGFNTSVGHVFRFRNAWNNNQLIFEYGGAPNSGYFYVNVPY